MSADGKILFFTRLPMQGSHTKRYRGGTAQTVWRYTTGSPEAIPLTGDYDGTSKNPLWQNGRIYFVTDRDGTMNLWSMDTEGKDRQQLTFHKGWDVKSPSAHNGRIVYQVGADLYLYDVAAKSEKLLPVTLSSDFVQLREKWVKNPMDYLTSVHLSPTGDRIALTARGQVFVAPAEDGRFVRVTDSNRIRHRSARFMPDGKSLLALSDETGETEFVALPSNGVGTRQLLTSDARILRFDGFPSPDGKWVAYTDKNEELWLYNLEKKTNVRILKTDEGGIGGIKWAPDSKWIAYTRDAANGFTMVCLYDITKGKHIDVTGDRVESYYPAWSPDGQWLYFVSDRVLQSVVPSPWGARQPEPYFEKTRKIYAVALTKDLRFPFLPNDELFAARQSSEKKEETKTEGKEAKTDPKETKSEGKEKKKIEVVLDLDGLQERVFEVPLPAGVYSEPVVTEKYLYFSERPAPYGGKSNLVALEIKNRDVTTKTIVEDIEFFELSGDGKKLLVRKGDELYVIEAGGSAPSELPKKKVDLKGWNLSVDPREEFRQMFVEAWRLERDYFYDPAMHGIDYQGLLAKHLPLVERVTDRDELSDLISSLVGELSALHIFVYGGDLRRSPDVVTQGSLGARMERDQSGGGYKIAHIYRSEPEYLEKTSPLSRPDLAIRDGDIILSINGRPTLSVESPDILLRNQAGQQVLLHLRSAQEKREFDAVVKPITVADESDLRYSEWEYTRRLAVEHKGKGDIGYVHLRAMGGGNFTEWAKNYYPVFDRKGLIIDVRHNRGGNIDSWVLEKLLRKAWFYWKGRTGKPYWNMQHAFRGHMIVLCNEYTASDGEAFSEGFRRLGLGKVLGTRTWGGEIWLSQQNFLVDKGIASAAETGVYGPEGEWLIEGRGVEPDITVDNLPHATFNGEDAQLDAAIRYLQEQIRIKPVEIPKVPPYPNKSFKY
jgi:tricorn protease